MMPGQYHLRHTFELPADRNIEEARLLVTGDERFELYLNGGMIGRGNDWRRVQRMDVTGQLNAGNNILAVKAEKRGTTAEPAGVLLNLQVIYPDGSREEVSSNDEWKIINREPEPGWVSSGFDDSDWQTVRSFGSSMDNNYWGRLMEFTHEGSDGRLEFVRASLVENDNFQKAMGRPPREIVSTRRDTDPTLLQALELTNGELVNDVLSRGADRWIREYGDNPDEMVRQIYLRALSRTPTEREARIAGDILTPSPGREAVQDLLWAVIMKPEFQLIY